MGWFQNWDQLDSITIVIQIMMVPERESVNHNQPNSYYSMCIVISQHCICIVSAPQHQFDLLYCPCNCICMETHIGRHSMHIHVYITWLCADR